MNLLLLIVIIIGVISWIYLTTRWFYGEYKHHINFDDHMWGGWSEYIPGHLKPIHFVKCIAWQIGIVGALTGLIALLLFLKSITITI